MTQFGLPLLPPVGAQAARDNHAEERNQSEMWSSEESFAARERRHGVDLMRVTVSGSAPFSTASAPTAGSVSRLRPTTHALRVSVRNTCAGGAARTAQCLALPTPR